MKADSPQPGRPLSLATPGGLPQTQRWCQKQTSNQAGSPPNAMRSGVGEGRGEGGEYVGGGDHPGEDQGPSLGVPGVPGRVLGLAGPCVPCGRGGLPSSFVPFAQTTRSGLGTGPLSPLTPRAWPIRARPSERWHSRASWGTRCVPRTLQGCLFSFYPQGHSSSLHFTEEKAEAYRGAPGTAHTQPTASRTFQAPSGPVCSIFHRCGTDGNIRPRLSLL